MAPEFFPRGKKLHEKFFPGEKFPGEIMQVHNLFSRMSTKPTPYIVIVFKQEKKASKLCIHFGVWSKKSHSWPG
jgi:hypothetical protein